MLLGGFDGAHVGHKSLFVRAREYGLPVGVMTIFGGKGKPLFTARERRRAFRRCLRSNTISDFASAPPTVRGRKKRLFKSPVRTSPRRSAA